MKVILILTLIYKSGAGGMGGVAMQEFNSMDACHKAGQQWEQQIEKKRGSRTRDKERFYLCVEK